MYNPENKLEKFFCGTPNYMAPEIAEKKPYISQLADMWSLGILVYKIFCADFPFKGKNEKSIYNVYIRKNKPSSPQDSKESLLRQNQYSSPKIITYGTL